MQIRSVLLAAMVVAASSCSKVADNARSPAKRVLEVESPTGVAMIVVPGGTFQMGSDNGPPDQSPRHEIQVSPFVMDKYEVTQDLYAQLEIPNPSHFKGDRRPVEQVRWSDAALICNERSRSEGLTPCYDETTFACDFEASGYRLPTEAEWEYAASSGGIEEIGQVKLASRACFSENAKGRTELVGKKRGNAWGLYDMLGNVAEWCNDVYAETYYAQSAAVDPRGPADGKLRILRGGHWKSPASECNVTWRAADNPGISDACFAHDTYGFRCVRRPTPSELSELSSH